MGIACSMRMIVKMYPELWRKNFKKSFARVKYRWSDINRKIVLGETGYEIVDWTKLLTI